jgi:hypothetical protein
MAEIRDAGEVYAEQVAQAAAAVQAAITTNDAQQQQAATFLTSEVEGDVHRPGPANAPSL